MERETFKKILDEWSVPVLPNYIDITLEDGRTIRVVEEKKHAKEKNIPTFRFNQTGPDLSCHR